MQVTNNLIYNNFFKNYNQKDNDRTPKFQNFRYSPPLDKDTFSFSEKKSAINVNFNGIKAESPKIVGDGMNFFSKGLAFVRENLDKLSEVERNKITEKPLAYGKVAFIHKQNPNWQTSYIYNSENELVKIVSQTYNLEKDGTYIKTHAVTKLFKTPKNGEIKAPKENKNYVLASTYLEYGIGDTVEKIHKKFNPVFNKILGKYYAEANYISTEILDKGKLVKKEQKCLNGNEWVTTVSK